MKNKQRIVILVVLLLLATGLWGVFSLKGNHNAKGNDQEQETEKVQLADATTGKWEEIVPEDREHSLPVEEKMDQVTENDGFILRADKHTGHFTLENKTTGNLLRSFPNPDAWQEQENPSAWYLHLESPFMFTYAEMKERDDKVKESNLFSNGTTEIKFESIEDGFRVTYHIPKLGFIIPIEVKLKNDYVETTVLADEIQDVKAYDKADKKNDRQARLVSLRAFPFLGADGSEKEDGFVFLPDGAGVLVDFKRNRASSTDLYSERIYGDDQAFAQKAHFSNRESVKMPVFGIKSKDQAVLGIVDEGDAYTNIVSAPSESFSQYNWVTGEHLLRFKSYQPTDKQKDEGYYSFSKKMQRTNRSIRYYMLDEEEPGYVDMAKKYRQYLVEDKGMKRIENTEDDLSMRLNVLGGGAQEGFILDSYLPLTTTDESMQIVQELNNLGINNMSVIYHGWKKGGYGTYGGHFPVDKELGGNKGMKDLANYAHKKGHKLYLEAGTYTYNNNGKDGFRKNRDGIRDLSSTVMKFKNYGNDGVWVSPLFMQQTIMDDMETAKELDIDGYLFGDGIGAILPTDYNKNHPAQRHEVKKVQEEILKDTKQELGDVQVAKANNYALQSATHIDQLANDYSYDLFVDESVPFAQIALHGLVTYSFGYGNLSGDVKEAFLNGMEYGAVPSFFVTYKESHELLELKARHRYYSTYYKDWETEMATQYQQYNDVLKDVQDQFIADHQQLAKGVFATTYENGKKIIVNYNEKPYEEKDIKVDAQSFILQEGGE